MTTLYLDMDGVVADWTKHAREVVGYATDDPKQRYPREDWQKILDQPRFYAELDKTPWADDLVILARRFRDELDYSLLFLSAIPSGNDIPWAFWDKFKWAEKYYPDIPLHFGPYSKDKHLHAKPQDILVDDRSDNCKDWSDAGGIALLCKNQNVLTDLKNLFDKKSSLKRLKSLT